MIMCKLVIELCLYICMYKYFVRPIWHAHLSALPSGSTIVAVVIRNHIVQLGSYLGSRPSSLLQGFCSCHKSRHNVIQQLKHKAQSGMIVVTCTQSAPAVLLLSLFWVTFRQHITGSAIPRKTTAVPCTTVGFAG